MLKSRYIYIYTNSYKPTLGGIQTVTSQIAESATKQGYKVIVVAPMSRSNWGMITKIEGVRLIRFPFALWCGGIGTKCRYIMSLILNFILLLFCRPAVVNLHFPLEEVEVVLKLKSIFNFRLITSFHGHDVLRYIEGYSTSSYQYHIQKSAILASSCVTACSSYLADKVKNIFKFDGSVVPIYNGVDCSRFEKVAQQLSTIPYLFAWGRLVAIKGYDILIKAFAQSKVKDRAELLIAGDGEQREELQNLINQLNVADSVKLIGRKSPTDVAQYATNSLANIIPSLREPFGIVALEAIAAHRPIIATKAGGLPEVLNSNFAIMVEPNDVTALCAAIEKVVSGGYKFNFEGAESHLKNFTIENMIKLYMSYYER